MDLNTLSAKINRISMDNIPKSMQDKSLERFCARFGKVNSITRTTPDSAVIEFGVTQ